MKNTHNQMITKTAALFAMASSVAACAGQTASSEDSLSDQANETYSLTFSSNWEESASNVLKAGQEIKVRYHTDRDSCQVGHNGFYMGETTLHYRIDGGEIHDLVLTDPDDNNPQTRGPFSTGSFVPAEEGAMEIWFTGYRSWGTNGSPCESIDSDFGKNYNFIVVEGDAITVSPQWAGDIAAVVTNECSSSGLCVNKRSEISTIGYGTWARQRAVRTEVQVDVWSPGYSDKDDATASSSFAPKMIVTYEGIAQPFTVLGKFIGRVGNNARFSFDIREADILKTGVTSSKACLRDPIVIENGEAVARASFYIQIGDYEIRPDGDDSSYSIRYSNYANTVSTDACN